MKACYLDASAAVKLLVAEPESDALVATLNDIDGWVSSRILAVEVSCTAQRLRDPYAATRADALLDRIDLIAIDEPVLERASEPFEPAQRALDAIHLASALSLPDTLPFVSYDRDQLAAAHTLGLECWSPGASPNGK